MRQFNPDFPIAGVVLLLVVGIVGFVIFVILATIGGVIGVPLFEKRKGPIDTPPSPQDFGGGAAPGPGGSYGAGL
jgi:hypothetical protein